MSETPSAALPTSHERYVPADAQRVVYPQANAVVYRYLTRQGEPALTIFCGRKAKPAQHIRATSACALDAYADRCIALLAKSKAEKDAERSKRAEFDNPLEVGSILVAVWGYEQTNSDFYQVTALRGARTLVLRKLCAKRTPGGDCMSGYVVPRPGCFTQDEPLTRRVIPYAASVGVRICSFAVATPWSGRPECYSSYA